MEDQFQKELIRLINICKEVFDVNISLPKLIFLRHKNGWGGWRIDKRKNAIIFINPDGFDEHFNEQLNDTLPHEVSHHVVNHLFGFYDYHGKEWKKVMKIITDTPKN